MQAISVAVPVLAGFLVSMLGQKEILTWYRGLNKPRWQPPAFLFGTTFDTARPGHWLFMKVSCSSFRRLYDCQTEGDLQITADVEKT